MKLKLPPEIIYRVMEFISEDVDSENAWEAVHGPWTIETNKKYQAFVKRLASSFTGHRPHVDVDLSLQLIKAHHACDRTETIYDFVYNSNLHEVVQNCQALMEQLEIRLIELQQDFYYQFSGCFTEHIGSSVSSIYHDLPVAEKMRIREELYDFTMWLRSANALMNN